MWLFQISSNRMGSSTLKLMPMIGSRCHGYSSAWQSAPLSPTHPHTHTHTHTHTLTPAPFPGWSQDIPDPILKSNHSPETGCECRARNWPTLTPAAFLTRQMHALRPLCPEGAPLRAALKVSPAKSDALAASEGPAAALLQQHMGWVSPSMHASLQDPDPSIQAVGTTR